MNTSSLRRRLLLYFPGMAILAVGLALNKQTLLGVSPLTAIAAVLAVWLNGSFANMTLVMYILFVAIELVLEKDRSRTRVIMILLQIPFSIVFTRIMGLVTRVVDLSGSPLVLRFLMLFLAIVLTGAGAAMMLEASLVPNPGDGVVKAIAAFTGKPLGLTKNIFDITNIAIAVLISLVALGRVVEINIGSLIAMLGVGRVIAVFNKLVFDRGKK